MRRTVAKDFEMKQRKKVQGMRLHCMNSKRLIIKRQSPRHLTNRKLK
jgi:hypothetical protein